MKTVPWNTAIQALVLVRLGQELGTQSQFARAVHDLVSALLAFGTCGGRGESPSAAPPLWAEGNTREAASQPVPPPPRFPLQIRSTAPKMQG